MWQWSPSQITLALAADTDLLAGVVDAVADPRGAARAADQRDIGGVERHVLVDDPALHRRPGRPLVLLGDVDAFDDDLVLVGDDAHDHAVFAEVLPGDDPDAVAFFELHDYSTSGAREMILMNLRSRSSRPTGPKMRVPRGCIWSFTSTAAFSSKRM